jgi:hypothetical protein
VIQEPINLPHYLGTGGPLLPSIEGERHSEGLSDPALESNMRRDRFILNQCHIIQQELHQPLSLAVWRLRVLP